MAIKHANALDSFTDVNSRSFNNYSTFYTSGSSCSKEYWHKSVFLYSKFLLIYLIISVISLKFSIPKIYFLFALYNI